MSGRSLRAWVVVALWIAGVPAVAHGFSSPAVFYAPTYTLESAGGGGGRWFTGSPAEGYGCDVCHGVAPSPRVYPLQVVGLPGRYVPGQAYDVQISWPTFSQVWSQLRPPPGTMPLPNAPEPAMGMVAEIVPQSGEAAGTIEIGIDPPAPEELCERASENERARRAVQLYQVRPDLEPRLIRADDDDVFRCVSSQLGQRCIVALLSCGAQQVRFRWTAPEQYEGTMWFSAGFVGSEARAQNAAGDSVFELTQPIIRADSPSGFYNETLEGESSCGIARAGQRGQRPWLLAVIVLPLLLRRCLQRRT